MNDENAARQKTDYEVRIVIKKNLSKEDRDFITNTIDEIAKRYGMYLHTDNVTYSKLPPYKKYEDIPAGTKFYFRVRKYKDKYLELLEYYSYAEGNLNGRRNTK